MALGVLHEHLHDLRALFIGLMDSDGHVPLPRLQTAVADMAQDWGLDRETVQGLLHPEGILTAANALTKDISGELKLARGEFLAALDGRVVEKRVCRTIQLHLAEVKLQFYRRANASGIYCEGGFEVQTYSEWMHRTWAAHTCLNAIRFYVRINFGSLALMCERLVRGRA